MQLLYYCQRYWTCVDFFSMKWVKSIINLNNFESVTQRFDKLLQKSQYQQKWTYAFFTLDDDNDLYVCRKRYKSQAEESGLTGLPTEA